MDALESILGLSKILRPFLAESKSGSILTTIFKAWVFFQKAVKKTKKYKIFPFSPFCEKKLF
jgi:hypothetical protein